MDARLNVEQILGLEDGDAHVIRNAGALVTDDVRRSLEASQALGTEEVVLLLHTDCGGARPATSRRRSAARLPRSAAACAGSSTTSTAARLREVV